MRQRINPHIALDVVDRLDAGKCVGAVDIHRAGAAHALTAGAAEGQRRVGLVLDLDQRVENHRSAIVEIDRVGVDYRIAAVIWVPAVDPELAQPPRIRRRRPGRAGADLGIPWKGKLRHVSRTAPWAGRSGPRLTR